MTVLDEIIAGVREDLEARRAEISLEELATNPAWACRMRLITARKLTPKHWPPMKSMWQRCWSSSTQRAFSA